MGKRETVLNAVIGAVVTVVFAFTVASPAVGGAVAGYLQRGSRADGARAGALSGALAFLPFVLFIALLFGAFLAVPMTGEGFASPGRFGFLAVAFVFPALLAWNVGLGALGGYLGVYVREELR